MKIITSKLNDKYYLIYKYLFKYSHNKFKLINNIILLNFLRENNNYICGNHFLYSFTKQVYNSIILKQNHKASYINLHNYINDKIYKNNNKCLIITNFISIVKNSYINNTNHKKIDTLFFYDINLTENKLLLNYPVVLTSKDKNFKINGTLYSSFNKKIYLQFLNNLKNNNEDNNILIPHIKYDIISCHYGYIYGLGLTASYNMTLQIVNIIFSYSTVSGGAPGSLTAMGFFG